MNKHTELIVDASPVGLGAVLAQHDKHGNSKVVAYASRTLTDVESRYSQTEREALVVTWGCLHFHLYLYGRQFTVVTDHKPLVSIFGNPNSKPPLRIERWILKLQQYDYDIIYSPGESNPADFMSRHPTCGTATTGREAKIAEEYVNMVVSNAVPKALTISEIQDETLKDDTLQSVIQAVRGRWTKVESSDSDLVSFYNIRDELTITPDGKVVLRGTRIVVPTTLQDRAIELAHEGHQGITKTKALRREKVWFPRIDSLTEHVIKHCIACQASTPSPRTHFEPLKMTPLPHAAWKELCMDFYGPLPSGEYLFVIIDEYSRFPVVEVVRSTSASTVIPVLDKVLSLFGIPDVIKSDNGPPFNSENFHKFAVSTGFKHRRITPLWPKANGEAERFMRNLNKVVKAAEAEHKSWKQELYKFLRNYRATPHSTTTKAPYTVLFGRPMSVKLPELNIDSNMDAELRHCDDKAKAKMKLHADRRSHAKESDLTEGDTVLVRQPKRIKTTPPFDPVPYRVHMRKGTMITASRPDHQITRNSSFFKRVPYDTTFRQPDLPEDELEPPITQQASYDEHVPEQLTLPAEPEVEWTSPVRKQQTAPRRSGRKHNPPSHLISDYVTKFR